MATKHNDELDDLAAEIPRSTTDDGAATAVLDDAVAYFSQGYNCAQACCSLTDPVSALMPTTA